MVSCGVPKMAAEVLACCAWSVAHNVLPEVLGWRHCESMVG